MTPSIVLGSASPRRSALLREMGIEFKIHGADIDETPFSGESPIDLALRLAKGKAHAVAAASLQQGQIESQPKLIIAADTVVAIGDQLLGKPTGKADARRMLCLLRAQPHQVHSAICILSTVDHRQEARVNTSTVIMRDYSNQEIETYIATGDPMDKAGAYAIQHPGFAPVAELDGCFAGVMGLPLGDLRDLLAEFGIEVSMPVQTICEEYTSLACCRRRQSILDLAEDP